MSLPVVIMLLGTMPVLLVASGFFSGSETALFSLTRHQRSQIERSKSVVNSALAMLLAETRGLLITLTLGNMTVNVLYFVIASALLIHLNKHGIKPGWLLVVASVLPLVVIILVGEVLPKLVAARLPTAWSRLVAVPLLVFHRLVGPVRITSSLLVIAPLARLVAPKRKPAALSPKELESLLELSQKQGVIDPDEERLLQQVLELGQLKVRDLMTPRVDIKAFDLEDDPADLGALIRETRLRHIPVYSRTIDDIKGIIYARRALLDPPESNTDLEALVGPVKFVPEQQRADRLLLELRKSGETFAMVVDEYGGTAGLVTIEDVVEHLVGDIPGAFKPARQPQVQPLGQGLWRISADLSVHDWADAFSPGQALQETWPIQAISTVGGLVMARLGRVPTVGDRITVGNLEIFVEKMNGPRINSLTIQLLDRDCEGISDTGERH